MLSVANKNSFRENKAQIFLLIILLAAMLNFFVGTFFSPEPEQKAQGFFGFTKALAKENTGSNYKDHNFISVFSIIFPAATGRHPVCRLNRRLSQDLSESFQ